MSFDITAHKKLQAQFWKIRSTVMYSDCTKTVRADCILSARAQKCVDVIDTTFKIDIYRPPNM